MTTIAVTNRKGGVGKSTMSLHIAAGLATIGYRVGLIDTDSQGHIAVSLGIPPNDALFEVLVEGAPLDDRTFPIVNPDSYSTPDNPSKGELRMLSSADKTYRIPHEMGEFDTFGFQKFIDSMKRAFNLQYVIIDTSPTLKYLDGYIYLATDAFFYVTELEPLAIQGLGKAIEQMLIASDDRRKQLRRATTVLGILPNKKRNTAAHQHGMEQLINNYGAHVNIWQPVKQDTVWTEASVEKLVVFRYAPSSKAAREAWRVVAKVIEAVTQWQKQNSRS